MKDTKNPAPSIDKWQAQLRKGSLDLAMLAILWEKKLYGLEILRELEGQAGLVVTEGTIYPLMSRLKKEGLVDSEWVESDAGHPRKYYRLSAKGKSQVQEMVATWRVFADKIEQIVKPVSGENP
ncbi:MAG: PadR family transcriptional regulator [Candidatus Eisenbacteria bacterium]|uniref:PadR family transcriptional regulator n=1 Tax=Eiseniibacteriota bacterium TaxID=2212470 RepID=A0A7Y2EBW0_UNCEI|nr:PadR family transcriptional regulator [Candidatus Eisenbacteria bacterium]